MSIERKLLAACIADRDAFDKIKDRFDSPSPEASQILELVGKFYGNDASADSVDVDYLNGRLDSIFDNPKKAKQYKDFVQDVLTTNVSIPNILDLLFEARKKDLAHRLAIALTNGDKDALDLMEEYQRLEESVSNADEDEVLHNFTAEQSVAAVLDSRHIIRLPTRALSEACDGGVTEGTHIVGFGRPEIGKTALSISCARAFSNQGLPGIYFGNEDPIQRIALRGQCAFSGMTKDQIKANPQECDRRLKVAHWDNMRLIPLHPGSPREIRKYVKMYKPKWIVVDQIRNLAVRADTRVNQLEAAAQEMRNIAGEFSLVGVSITQAGDSAENKLTLGMGDVDFSNTGIPATADLMIGFGADEQYKRDGYRMISLPKNKISGNHTNFRVRINEQLSRIEDL